MAKLALLLLLAQSIAGVSVPPRMGHPVVEDQDDQPARSLEDEQERREGRLLARGTSVGADFSQVQLTYLGRDRLLSFNQWTGEYELWQYGELTPLQRTSSRTLDYPVCTSSLCALHACREAAAEPMRCTELATTLEWSLECVAISRVCLCGIHRAAHA